MLRAESAIALPMIAAGGAWAAGSAGDLRSAARGEADNVQIWLFGKTLFFQLRLPENVHTGKVGMENFR